MDGDAGSLGKEKITAFEAIKGITLRYHSGTIPSAEYALGVIYKMIQEAHSSELLVKEYEAKMKLYDTACRREDAVNKVNSANP
jgi:hypothetical protein